MHFPASRSVRIAAIVAGLGVPGMWLAARGHEVSDAAMIAPAKRGKFTVTVTTSGELRARQFVQITAPPNAMQAGAYQMKISSIVPEGTVVRTGDVVAELDRSTLASKLNEVTLALQKAQAQFEQAMLDSALTLSAARENIHTLELGLEEKRLAKEQSVYEAPTVRRQAEIDYEKAQRALDQARTDYTTKTEQSKAKMREVGADLARQRSLLQVVQDVDGGIHDPGAVARHGDLREGMERP
jgi:multidrug efflux pump subunit AcrA (membrane-fusion protein)